MALEGDIGSILFRGILQMYEYPGSPFTGNIFNDLIMFFIVPSIFIILVVYMTVGRIVPPGIGSYGKLRVLLGVGLYLFIVAGGYFRVFALLAGPYFLFLIFIMGLLYFFAEHFIGKRGGAQAGAAAGGGGAGGPAASVAHYENMNWQELNLAKQRVDAMIRELNNEIKRAEINHEPRLETLRGQRAEFTFERHEIEQQMSIMKRMQRRLPGPGRMPF